jgi:hypothetical protein
MKLIPFLEKIISENTIMGKLPEGPTGQRIGDIQDRLVLINKLLPSIESFFKKMYKDELVHLDILFERRTYANEHITLLVPTLVFKFKQRVLEQEQFKKENEISKYILDVFGINLKFYGVPLDILVKVT